MASNVDQNTPARGRLLGWLRWATVLPAIAAIQAYQFAIRPLLIGNCKFCPNCSEYGIEALHVHGLFRGSWLTLRRVIRCHPFSPGGIDPVPPSVEPHPSAVGVDADD